MNAHDFVHARIRELIVSGRLAPGALVITTEVSTRLQVSRTPVRSALRQLLAEGFLVANHSSARLSQLVVAPLTQQGARQTFALACAVKGAAVALAAKLDAGARMRLTSDLRDLCINPPPASGGKPSLNGDRHVRAFAFHRRYVVALGDGPLVATDDVVGCQAERYRRMYCLSAPEGSVLEYGDYQRIVSAIEQGKPSAAQTAVKSHWQRIGEAAEQAVASIGEFGAFD